MPHVAQEIVAYCPGCRFDLAHIIVAMAGQKILKVECKACHRTHAFRLPRPLGAQAAGGNPARRPAAGPKPATKRTPKLPEPPPDCASYDGTRGYQPGEWLLHPNFGPGQVLRRLAATKMEVLFADRKRILLQNRTDLA